MRVRTVNGTTLAGLRAQVVADAIKRDSITRPGHYVVKVGAVTVDFDLNDDGNCTLRKLTREGQS